MGEREGKKEEREKEEDALAAHSRRAEEVPRVRGLDLCAEGLEFCELFFRNRRYRDNHKFKGRFGDVPPSLAGNSRAGECAGVEIDGLGGPKSMGVERRVRSEARETREGGGRGWRSATRMQRNTGDNGAHVIIQRVIRRPFPVRGVQIRLLCTHRRFPSVRKPHKGNQNEKWLQRRS